jgi:hypothetical protein
MTWETVRDYPAVWQCSSIYSRLASLGWKIINHPPYSPGLTSSDFHLFGLVKVHLRGQKFQTDDELKYSVLNWLHSKGKTFYAVGISSMPGQWKKCVYVKGEYLEKGMRVDYSGMFILFVKK